MNNLIRILYLLLLISLASCKHDTKTFEVGNGGFCLKKELADEVSFIKKYDENFLLKEEKWFYKSNDKPFLVLRHDSVYQFYDKKIFNEKIIDTPKILRTQIDDTLYLFKIIPRNYPIRFLSGIGWHFINIEIQKETKSNMYIMIANKNSIQSNQTPYFTFKFFDPIPDREIKSIDSIPINFSN